MGNLILPNQDLIENYLNEQGFNYIKRKDNKIVFHKYNFWTLFDVKSFLVSGIVKTKIKNGNLIVINGNWMIFLLAIPFLVLILTAKSKFSTLEKSDVDMIWGVFAFIFGGNLIFRVIAHISFSETIKDF
ncbi:MAG: hypothetical protein L3J14_00865 [Flavobacteriaceae bacterium]|nr:hypothetical protein [Flavobacteriaceae bacterium]